MMYLENVTTPQTKYLPRHRKANVTGTFRLTLRNTVSGQTWTVEASVADELHYMWAFTFSLPEGMEEGEYEYTLSRGSKTYDGGVAHIGEYHATRVEYHSNSNVIQYGG